MSADPSLFVFGHLADPEHLAQQARRDLAGLFHGFRIDPLDPRPGNPVRLRLSSSVESALDQVTVTWWDDRKGQSSERKARFLSSELLWDEYAWRYLRQWEFEIPGLDDGARVRYTATGASRASGATIHADTPPGEPPRIFGYDVDTLAAPDWIRDAVIYQIFVDRFFDGGVGWGRPLAEQEEIYGGTIRGVTAKLDYLAGLGVTAIWLTPVFESETYHGYDAVDYERVAGRLGGDSALRELVAEAHGRDIRVLVDLAANHCSWRNPKFLDARADPNSRYRDWFEFTTWPDEYESFFGVPDLPHLNGRNPEVAAYMGAVASYYLAGLDIDGFRLDYALGPSLLFWTDFQRAVRAGKGDAYTVGEATTGPGRLKQFEGRLDGCLDFPGIQLFRQFFITRSIDAAGFHETLEAHAGYFDPGFVLPTFLDNHDMNRFLWSAGGDTRILALAALCQLTLPKPPIVYYGTETGLSQTYDVGDGGFAACRLPMDWENIDRSLFQHYQTVLSVRHAHPALRRGRRTVLAADGGLYAYRSDYTTGEGIDDMIITVLNNSSEPARLRDDILTGDDVLSGTAVSGSLELGPYQGALIVPAREDV